MVLGEFEYLVLACASGLPETAYGAVIRRALERAGRRCSIGALYTTLTRLERKGLIVTGMSGAMPQRGGRRRRLVRVTAVGEAAAAAFYVSVMRASAGVPWALREGSADGN